MEIIGKLIQFKAKFKKDSRVDDFLEQLEMTKQLFLQGDMENVLIIAEGNGEKYVSSSGLDVAKGWEMCRDFIKNAKEYMDD